MRFLAPLVCALLLGLAAPAAFADDDTEPKARPKSAVEELLPDERAALEKRLPKPLASYTPEQQERIARGVLRLRNLTPEQRAKLEQRMAQALAAKRAGVDLDKKFAAMRRNRRHYDASFKIAKGVGQLLRESLDEATQTKLAGISPRLRGRHLDMVFSRLFIENVITETERGIDELDAATLPERVRKMFDAERAKLADAPVEKAQRLRRRLAHLVVTGKVMQLLEGIERPKRGERRTTDAGEREQRRQAYEAYVRAVGEKAKATWSAAFDATVAKITGIAEDPEQLAKLLVRQASREREGRMRGMGGVWRLLLIERQLRGLPSESKLREHLNALLRGLLVERHKLDPAKVDAVLAQEGPERSRAFRELLRSKADMRGARPGGGIRRGGRGPQRGPRPGQGRDGDDEGK